MNGACRQAPPSLPPLKDPADSIPSGWCASSCTGEAAYELDLDQAFGDTTPGTLLAHYLGTWRGVWIHPEHDPKNDRFLLVPNQTRQRGRFRISYRKGAVQYMRGKVRYTPPRRGSYGCPLISTPTCRDYLAYSVNIQIQVDDQILNRTYEATLNLHPRVSDGPAFDRSRERASLNVIDSPISWSGTQSHRPLNGAGNRKIRDYLRISFHKAYMRRPDIEIFGDIEEIRRGDPDSLISVDGQELFYFKPIGSLKYLRNLRRGR